MVIPIPDAGTLGLFMVAALVLLITPGPAVLYIVARSLDQGRSAGLISALGVHVGTLVHVAAAALGVSAALAASATAFAVVKYLGAGYLIYLGIRRVLDRAEPEAGAGPARAPLARIFGQGIVVNVLNPKTGLFFLAFLPQFVDPARGAVAAQILVFGLLFIALGICTDGAWAIGAGTARQWLGARPRNTAGQRYVVGGVYVGLGLVAAFSSASRTK
jgi:threonine/homoserine/homoserine lactone efflux protein